jgi:diguanylate cyclase (GGDEF)-like protein
MTLVLNPPDGGFSEETMKLAEWLSSQAAIALENARLHDIVQFQAITDELTGLVNRRRFLEALRSEITRGKRLGGRLSVVLADLDGFKLVNDRFGHHAGDEVLIAFADLLRAHGRDVDVAARLGGEEFAILLPETGLDGASTVADRLCRSLAELQIPLGAGEKVTVTASFGVAELGESQSVDGLLRAADSALYRAKEHGKNRVELAGRDAA